MTADRAQRQRALDPSESFIVQAPAGSGKTEVLTQRFLGLLALVSRPEQVLAITFTRKATQEMRSRITKRLAQAQAEKEGGEPPGEPHEVHAVRLATRVLERDRELGWNLIENPGRLRITTIDGLCTQLLARDPVRGPRWAGVRVLEDPRSLYREAIRRLFSDIDELADDKSGGSADSAQRALVSLLVHLGGDARALESLLLDMLRRRTLWARHLETAHDEMEALLNHRQEVALGALHLALGEAAFNEAQALAAQLGFDAGAAAPDVGSRLRAAAAFARLLSTKQRKPCAPRTVSRKLFPDMREEDAPALDRLKSIYASWHEDEQAKDALERTAAWPPLDWPLDGEARNETDPLSLLNDARRVLSLALVELDALMAETAQADFTAVADAALASLGSDTQPADTLLAEDARIEHILMDEFQDTSFTQFQLLQRLTAGWQPSDGRSLFLVGDPMQSIYRFREANVGFFNEVVQSGYLGQIPVEPLSLTANFRSRQELTDWFNATFAGVFPERDESDSGAVRYSPVTAEAGSGGEVRLEVFDKEDPTCNLDDRIVTLVSEALADHSEPSVAILVRARSQVRKITEKLQAAGIDFEAVDMEPLGNRPVVSDLQSLCRALVHPLDRVAWIALLRAPWCGLTMREIHAVVGEDATNPVFQSLAEAAAGSGLEASTQERVVRLYTVMRHARARAGSHPLVALVQMCWLQLAGPLCCADASDLQNAEVFFELLEELEQEGAHEIVERLDELLQERYAASRPARVKIMTIHNAKGLEFDQVIIPDLERRTGRSDRPLVSLQEFAGESGQGGVLMAALTPAHTVHASLYEYLRRVDAERERFESQRVLYVACTRARKRLHLLAKAGVSAKGFVSAPANTFLGFLETAFRPLLDGLVDAAADRDGETAAVSEQAGALPLLRLASMPKSPDFPEPGGVQEQRPLACLPNREAVAIGSVLHEWLELIHDHPEPEWNAARIDASQGAIRSCLLRAGAAENRVEELTLRCVAALRAALADDDLKSVLALEREGQSWSELELYRRDGPRFSRHVIDLLIRHPRGGYLVLDYKSGFRSEAEARDDVAWQDQLRRYRELVESLTGEPASEGRVHLLEQTGLPEQGP